MKKSISKKITLLPLLALSIFIYAQKPSTIKPLEIIMPRDTVSKVFMNNKLVEPISGIVIAQYDMHYKVNPATPENMARQFLVDKYSDFGFSSSSLNDLILHSIRPLPGGWVVRLRQYFNGIPVNDSEGEVTVKINKQNEVVYVLNGYQRISQSFDISPKVNFPSALTNIKKQLKITKNISPSKQGLMILKTKNIEKLTYSACFLNPDLLNEYRVIIDANTGEILEAKDVTLYSDGHGNIFNPDPLSSAKRKYGDTGFNDNNDANSNELDDQLINVTLKNIEFSGGVYKLKGPYAEIIDDELPNNGLFTQSSSDFNFRRNHDAFEGVMCYYFIDYLMRYINNDLGISLTPYQYSGGVRFDPSGLGGDDNSHYKSGSGSLAFGEGGVDDAEDADVILHELGHGIHDWITNGGLSNSVDGLSEGFGDYLAVAYSRILLQWSSNSQEYNWVFSWDGHNEFWSGRTTNFATTYPNSTGLGIHLRGQIFSTAMMKIWEDIGHRKTAMIALEGLATTNANTNQPQAAAAILQAAIDLNYPANELCLIKQRFDEAGYTGFPNFTPSNTYDLYSKDLPTDIGIEPSYAWPMWVSEDVWVRNQDDGSTNQQHQNPIHNSTTAQNYIYVRVRNRGCIISDAAKQVEVRWAKANTNLTWPDHWYGAYLDPPNNTALAGDLIGYGTIPQIQPGGSVIVKIQTAWNPPHPDLYVVINNGDPWHFCLLSRIIDPNDPLTDINEIGTYVTTYNNIIWRNTTVIDNEKMKDGGDDCFEDFMQGIGNAVAISNANVIPATFDLVFSVPKEETGTPITQEGKVMISLDDQLYEKWVAGGKKGTGFTEWLMPPMSDNGENNNNINENSPISFSNRKMFEVTGTSTAFNNITLDAKEVRTHTIGILYPTDPVSTKQEFQYDVIQRRTDNGTVTGGVRYAINKPTCNDKVTSAGSDRTIGRGCSTTLSATPQFQCSLYWWLDHNNHVFSQNSSVTVWPTYSTTYTLKTVTAEGCLSEAQVRVNVDLNNNSIACIPAPDAWGCFREEKIEPNPAGGNELGSAEIIHKALIHNVLWINNWYKKAY